MTADVSIGGSGSEPGFSSVFIRKENAKIVSDYIKKKEYIVEELFCLI